MVTAVAMLFLVAFGIKAAVFPLFFWLPASYHTPPAAVSALFAGLLTKVGVYALIRVFTLLFMQDAASPTRLLLVLSGLTMVTGVLGAAAQNEFRRVLSFHIISQIGYMIMGLALYHAAGAWLRLDLLHRPPHHREDQPVPGRRRRPAAVRDVRAEELGRPLPVVAAPGRPVPDPGAVPGRDAAAVRVLRQARRWCRPGWRSGSTRSSPSRSWWAC